MANPVRILTAAGWQDLTATQGPSGAVLVYEQASDPGAVPVGSIWVETDVNLAVIEAVPDASGQDGKWLQAQGGAAIWGAPPVPAYGTSLPASPVDTQEAILVDSLTLPTYQWRFRYVASITDAYKWVFVGGAPAIVAINVQQSPTVFSAWSNLATIGPSFVLPRSGIYDTEVEGHFGNTAADWAKGHFGLTYGPSFPGPSWEHTAILVHSGAGGSATGFWSWRLPVFPATTELRVMYFTMNVNNNAGLLLAHCYYNFRKLSVLPVRVS